MHSLIRSEVVDDGEDDPFLHYDIAVKITRVIQMTTAMKILKYKYSYLWNENYCTHTLKKHTYISHNYAYGKFYIAYF